jgi:hypothetical protein
MKELLELGYRQASIASQKTALIAAGYTQALIDELQTISDTIDSLNAEQEDMLAERGDRTQTRIEAYNAVWEFMQKINKASKVTFEDNPAKLEMYLLYPTASQSLPKPQNLHGVVMSEDPSQVLLSWDAVVGAEVYRVYFSEAAIGAPSGNFQAIEETKEVLNVPVPLVEGLRNYWKIKAFGGGLESAYSDEIFIDGNQ